MARNFEVEIYNVYLKNHILQRMDVSSSSAGDSTSGLLRFQFAQIKYDPTGNNTALRQYDPTGNNMIPILVPWLTTKWCEILKYPDINRFLHVLRATFISAVEMFPLVPLLPIEL